MPIISSIRSFTLLALAFAPLAAADWYVRAGADGDGSAKDKPLPVMWKAVDGARRRRHLPGQDRLRPHHRHGARPDPGRRL